jgi:ribosome-associated protein
VSKTPVKAKPPVKKTAAKVAPKIAPKMIETKPLGKLQTQALEKPKAAKAKAAGKTEKAALEKFICDSLDADKGVNVVSIDLAGKTSIADYMVIVTGTSSRHVVGMAQKLRDRLSEVYKIKAQIEGTETGDWVIVDAGDVMVHLFREEVRGHYNLEKLWGADFSTVDYTLYRSV